MKKYALTIIAALFATNSFATEIPKRVQQKILAGAPELDHRHPTGFEAKTGWCGSQIPATR
jgi:hypothetical protein